MRDILNRLIDDNHERELPALVPRETSVVEVEGKATTIIGMRRVGKTWFCYQRMQELLQQGVPKERLLYLNFEDDRLLPFNAHNFEEILDTYFAKFPSHKNELCYFFFDEIQKIDGWESFVRRILDTERATAWITGSSSKLLSREIATNLRGRSLSTEIFPLSFREFLRFHEVPLPSKGRVGSRARAELQHMAQRYLVWGGFPEIQSVEDPDTRRQILRDYQDVVLFRDVVERHSVTNVKALRSLLQHVMAAPSTRFSVNKFYNTLRSRGVRCTKNSLYEFLDHLSDAYLIYQVPIHSRSEKMRQVNPRKFYVIDTGLLAASSFGMTEDKGALLENLTYIHLRRQGVRPEYYVSESGTEVDFVLPGRKPSDRRLIQVCWSLAQTSTREREIAGLRSAMCELRLKHGTIVTWLEEGEDEGIEIVPAWRWLLTMEG